MRGGLGAGVAGGGAGGRAKVAEAGAGRGGWCDAMRRSRVTEAGAPGGGRGAGSGPPSQPPGPPASLSVLTLSSGICQGMSWQHLH